MALAACTDCGQQVSAEAAACPGCGRMTPKAESLRNQRQLAVALGLIAVLLVVAFVIANALL